MWIDTKPTQKCGELFFIVDLEWVFFSYAVLVRWISFYNLSLNALNRNYVGIQLGSVKYFAIEWYENPIDFWCPREVENVFFCVEKINLSVSKAAATIIGLWIFEFSWIRFSIFFYSILFSIPFGYSVKSIER